MKKQERKLNGGKIHFSYDEGVDDAGGGWDRNGKYDPIKRKW
jgi:hypothetical protein